jgi:tRNA U38,U39,U40 pseudouridine synthase TruA
MFIYGMPLPTTLEGVLNVRTVESDVMAALGGRTCVAAGRTDKDVSALSQVRLAGPNCSFHAKDFSDTIRVIKRHHKYSSRCIHEDIQTMSS